MPLQSCIVVLFIAVFVSSCNNDLAEIQQLSHPGNLPQQTARNIEVYYSDSAKAKIKLTSPLLYQFAGDSSYEEFPEGVDVKFYDDSAKIKSTLTSKYAIRKKDGRIMEAKKDVVVVNEKGEQLNTEYLIWDEQRKLIYTEAFVKITTGDEIIYGDGLESNQDFSKYKIKNIKGTIYKKQE